MINIQDLISDYENWHMNSNDKTRLNGHEVVKSLLVAQSIVTGGNPMPETIVRNYKGNGQYGIIDFMDNECAIEIDTSKRVKSIKKLEYARDKLGKRVLWIMILKRGKGGSARSIVEKKKIPTIRLFARNNSFSWDWAYREDTPEGW